MPGRAGRALPEGWDPVAEFQDLHDRMGQLFARTFGEGRHGGLPPWLPGWSPPADVFETERAFTVVADLPGVRREDLHVEARGLELVITGEFRERDLGHAWRRSRPTGPFECRVTLPGPFDPAGTEATLADGVLTVTLPKTAAVRPQEVHITPG